MGKKSGSKEIEALKAEVERLRRRVEELETERVKLQKAAQQTPPKQKKRGSTRRKIGIALIFFGRMLGDCCCYSWWPWWDR